MSEIREKVYVLHLCVNSDFCSVPSALGVMEDLSFSLILAGQKLKEGQRFERKWVFPGMRVMVQGQELQCTT